MPPTPITSLAEAYQAIQDAMKDEQWVKAYQICLEVLRSDPENLKVINLKNQIEKNVKKANQQAIEDDIKQLEPLWKEKKYAELLEHFKQLEPYMKDFPKLRTLILKAKKLYEEELSQGLEQKYQGELARINELLKAKNFKEALFAAEKLREMDIHYPDVKKLQAKVRADWIDTEIEANKILLSGEKYENILLFYQKLLKIDPDSVKVKNLIEQTQKTYGSTRRDDKKEFLYKALEQMHTLYQLKKYEKTVQVCAEILAIDPDNKMVQDFQKKSEKKAQNVINKEVIEQILTNQKGLADEAKANPGEFIKI